MIKTSLAAMGVAAVAMISILCNGGGLTGDDNPRPPTPVCRTIDSVGNKECKLETGKG